MAAAADASQSINSHPVPNPKMLYKEDLNYYYKIETFMLIYLASIAESIRLVRKPKSNTEDPSLLPVSNLPKSSLNNNARKTAKNLKNSGNNSRKNILTRNNKVSPLKISEVFKEFMNNIATKIYGVETPRDLFQNLRENLEKKYESMQKRLSELEKENHTGDFIFLKTHGSYNKMNIQDVPDNTIIIFTTPLNRYGYSGKCFRQSKIEFFSNKANRFLLQNNITCIDKGIDSREISNNNKPNFSELDNIFKNAIVFLPGQKYFDIQLSYTKKDANDGFGIYKNLNNQESYESTELKSTLLSKYIEKYYTSITTSIPTFFIVSGCRSLNSEIPSENNNTTNSLIIKGQLMYKYEHFILYYNTLLLNCFLGTETKLKKIRSSRNISNRNTSELKLKLIFSEKRIQEFKKKIIPKIKGGLINAGIVDGIFVRILKIIGDGDIINSTKLKEELINLIRKSRGLPSNMFLFNELETFFLDEKGNPILKTPEKLKRIQNTSLRLGDTQRTFLHQKLNEILETGNFDVEQEIYDLSDSLSIELFQPL